MNAPLRCGLALGSNLGDRLSHLRRAGAAIAAIAGVVPDSLGKAPVYETDPVGCPPGSPAFLNTVVEVDYHGDPMVLLEHAQRIERALGRERGAVRNAARTVDIDLLYAGDCLLQSEALELPHPRLQERSFVLVPLAELRPDLVLPGQSATVRELLSALQGDGKGAVRRFARIW